MHENVFEVGVRRIQGEDQVIYFSADTHFSHENIIKYCNRPFENVEQMNETMISNWNKVVKSNDDIYFLGDFGLGTEKHLLPIYNRLNGRKFLIVGSHDRHSVKLPWSGIDNIKVIHIEKIPITLCHYAMRTWHKSHFNSWHLYGHSHGRLQGFGKSFDVGVDAWNFTPVSFHDVKAKMSYLDDNFNLVERMPNKGETNEQEL